MKMMTKKKEKRLAKYPLGSQREKGDEAMVIVKYHHPYWRSLKWYVIEGEKVNDADGEDWEFYGLRVGTKGNKICHFSLSELESGMVFDNSDATIEIKRDTSFKPLKLGVVRRLESWNN